MLNKARNKLTQPACDMIKGFFFAQLRNQVYVRRGSKLAGQARREGEDRSHPRTVCGESTFGRLAICPAFLCVYGEQKCSTSQPSALLPLTHAVTVRSKTNRLDPAPTGRALKRQSVRTAPLRKRVSHLSGAIPLLTVLPEILR